MAAQVTVLLGPARSGKTQWLLAEYRRVLQQQRPGAALWLAPTWRAAETVRRQLLAGGFGGCFSPNVMTFARFADMVVDGGPDRFTPISDSAKQHLVRWIVQQLAGQGRLQYYGPVAHTAGLVHRICAWLSELKRLDVWPEHFRRACRRRRFTEKNADLCTIYEAYQQVLTEHQLYDAEGRFWQARQLLRENHAVGLDTLGLLVVDGFTDFTPPQHEILEILAARSERILISLPAEKETRRADLFRKSLDTLDQLQKQLGAVEQEWFSRTDDNRWPAMRHLEATLFVNPRDVPPDHCIPEPERMEILAASSQRGEIELVASRIKQLLIEGDDRADHRPVAPGQVAVVFRSPEACDELLREVFSRTGIPFSIEVGRPLARSRVLRALVDLLRLHVEDWPFRRLLAVLGSNFFHPAWPQWQGETTRLAAERVIRRLQIAQGREELLRVLGQMANHQSDAAPATRQCSERPTESHSAAEASAGEVCSTTQGESDAVQATGGQRAESDESCVYRLLVWLKEVFESMPASASLRQWITALQELARQTGLERAVETTGAEGTTSPEIAHPWGASQSERPYIEELLQFEVVAWNRFWDTLQAEHRLQEQIGRETDRLTAAELLAELSSLLAETTVWQLGNETGRVRILRAASVRATEIPYLFFAGLSERSFPAPEPQAELHTPTEREQLIRSGLRLPPRGERSSREMLLFYEVVTRATRRIWFSYPALDDDAQPLLPSPYLSEIQAVFGGRQIPRREFLDLDPVVRHWEPVSGEQLRTRAIAEALSGNERMLPLLKAYDSGQTAEAISGGLTMVALREGQQFGPAEGKLDQAAIRSELAERFGRRHAFSATELESFSACPFRYYLYRVLHLRQAPEPALVTDYAGRGSLAHRLTARLHRELGRRYPEGPLPHRVPADEFRHLVDEIVSAEARLHRGGPVETALAQLDRRWWRCWVEACGEEFEKYYEKSLAEYQAAFVPEFIEVSFGRVPPEEEDLCEQEAEATDNFPALELRHGKRCVRIAGRIDRIDTARCGHQMVFHLIDYKTGAVPSAKLEEVATGYWLQLPLYVMAVREVILADRKAHGGWAGFWSIGNRDAGASTGFKRRIVIGRLHQGELQPDDQWTEIEQAARAAVFQIVEAIRKGCFPVFSANENCTGNCPYSTICRVNQARALEKQWSLDSSD